MVTIALDCEGLVQPTGVAGAVACLNLYGLNGVLAASDLTNDISVLGKTLAAFREYLSQRSAWTTLPLPSAPEYTISSQATSANAVVSSSASSGTTTPVVAQAEAYVAKHRLAAKADEAVAMLLEASLATEKDGWIFDGEKNGVRCMRRKPDGSGINCMKGSGRVNAPPKMILEVVDGFKYKKEYDQLFKQGVNAEQLDELTRVGYMEYIGIWPTSPRDFVVMQSIRRLPDGGYVLAGVSVEHPDHPELSGFVRANIVCGGFVIRPVEGEPMKTDLVYVAQVDLRGSIPSAVVNKVTAAQPMVVANVRNICDKLPDKEKYVEIAKLVPASSISSEALGRTEQSSLLSSSAASVAADSDLKASIPPQVPTVDWKQRLGDRAVIEFRTLANQAIADVMAEALETSQVTPSNAVTAKGNGWSIVNVEKNVVILKKAMPNSPINCVMGKGIINANAMDIYKFVKESTNRNVYDNMLKSIEVVARIDDNLFVMHMLHETNQCLMRHSRDFSILVQDRVDTTTGRYVVAGTSIASDLICREVPGVVRATVFASGWVMEPLDERRTMVTYVAQIDLKGNVPSRLINIISVKQPLCIAYLRKHMESLP
eukprot:Opistho-2@56171